MEPGSAGQKEDRAFSGQMLEGIIAARSRQLCEVWTERGTWRCSVRGKLWEEDECLLVGDRVCLRTAGSGDGVIEKVLPRRTVFSRQVGEGRRKREHRYCANVDTVLVVCAAKEPPLRPALIDRVIISARSAGAEPVLCLNKIDLDVEREASRVFDLYRRLGFSVIESSAHTGAGIAALAGALKGRISVFSGHSGVGKTSLLSALVPGLQRRTRSVGKRARGRHATTEVYLIELPQGGFVVDTPGFREFTVWGIAPEDIACYYEEFLPHAENCRFNNCLHLNEPDCAVRKAVEVGAVSKLRYRNYVRLLQTHGGPLPA